MAERKYEVSVFLMSTREIRENLRKLNATPLIAEDDFAFCYIDKESIMRYQIGIGKLHGEIALNSELIPKNFLPFYRRHELAEFLQRVNWYKSNFDDPPLVEKAAMHIKAIEAEYNLALKHKLLDEYHDFTMKNGTPEGLPSIVRVNAYERIKKSMENPG